MRLMVLGMMMVLPAAAIAQGTNDQRGACMSDALRLCSAYIPDERAIETCLEQNQRSLTPACQAQFDAPTPAAPAQTVRRR